MNINKDKLLDALEHINYEIDMLFASAESLPIYMIPSPLHNMRLESFAIHCRNIIDFLYKPISKDDDICAEHYVLDIKEWCNIRGEITEFLNENRKRANKHIAHLTFHRIKQDKIWNIQLLMNELLKLLILFYDSLGDEWKDWFPTLKALKFHNEQHGRQ